MHTNLLEVRVESAACVGERRTRVRVKLFQCLRMPATVTLAFDTAAQVLRCSARSHLISRDSRAYGRKVGCAHLERWRAHSHATHASHSWSHTNDHLRLASAVHSVCHIQTALEKAPTVGSQRESQHWREALRLCNALCRKYNEAKQK